MVCAQAFELGAAKWEFENARKAFGDTMRKFAPGGGAGHFLANAIARRTDRVRHICRSQLETVQQHYRAHPSAWDGT